MSSIVTKLLKRVKNLENPFLLVVTIHVKFIYICVPKEAEKCFCTSVQIKLVKMQKLEVTCVLAILCMHQ